METSQQLVEGVLAGAPEAFDAFYELYFGRIYLFARRRTHSEADAEDLCRSIFERVLASLRAYRDERNLDVWVLAIAKRELARSRGARAVSAGPGLAVGADG